MQIATKISKQYIFINECFEIVCLVLFPVYEKLRQCFNILNYVYMIELSGLFLFFKPIKQLHEFIFTVKRSQLVFHH